MISIIISTQNRESLLIDQLNSLINQSYTNWECIIVNDSSTAFQNPTLCSLLISDSRFLVHQLPKHMGTGPSAGRNFALSKAKGDFIQFVDDDDYCHPQMLEIKVELINRHSVDFIVTTHIKLKHRDFSHFARVKYNIDDFDNFDLVDISKAIPLVDTSFKMVTFQPIFKNHVLQKLRFPVNLKYGEEANLFLEIILRGFEGVVYDIPLYVYYKHLNSLTGKVSSRNKKQVNYVRLAVLMQVNKLFSDSRLVPNAYILNKKIIKGLIKRLFKFKLYRFEIKYLILHMLTHLKFLRPTVKPFLN
jgi:glycosyltransferase involved in cell wall biosynthesis